MRFLTDCVSIDRFYFIPSKKYIPIEIPELVLKEDGREHRAIIYRQSGVNDNKKRAMLISHGNAGNIYYRRHLLDHILPYYDGDIYCFEYPGFGRLRGKTNIASCVAENFWWYTWLLRNGYTSVDLYGESIGGGILIKTLTHIGDRSPIRRIYLQSTFSSIKKTIKETNILLYILYKFLGKNDLNSVELLEIIDFGSTELIFIHSPEDTMISIEQAFENMNRANTKNKRFFVVNGGHNDIQLKREIFAGSLASIY